MNTGVRFGDKKISMLLYADDVVAMSELADELQSIVDMVGRYRRGFGVSFCTEKSNIIIVNRMR